jgi:acyl carrier protein
MVKIDDIVEMVSLQLGRRGVSAEHRILEDLGAESVDLVNIVARVEDRYAVTIEEEELPDIVTVADLYQCVARKTGGG